MTESTDSRPRTALLREQVGRLDSKWALTFAGFAERCENDTLGQDPYGYEVESDVWEWEAAITLLAHHGESKNN